MAEQPFPDDEQAAGLAGPDPQAIPKASGVRRPVLLSAVVLFGVLVMSFVVFGGRAARQFKQATLPSVDAAPQSAPMQNPLRGVATDYSGLLEKPPAAPVAPFIPPFPQNSASVPPPPQPPPMAPAVAAPQGGSRQERDKREQGVLVVQGGKQRKGNGGMQGAVTPAVLPASGEGAGGSAEGGEARKLTSKEGFQAQAGARIPETMQDRLHAPASPYAVLAGDTIPAALLPGIHSDLPNAITAQVSLDVRDSVDGRHVLIPQGSRLFGVYDAVIVHGQDRVLIAWQRLRLPNGDSVQLEGAPGVDVAGYAGLKDKVDTHFWSVLRAVLMSSVLSIGARVPFGDTEGEFPTMAQQFASEFGRGVNQAGQKIVNRELNRQPTIKIRPGMRLNVLVHRDLVLRPWDSGRATYAP